VQASCRWASAHGARTACELDGAGELPVDAVGTDDRRTISKLNDRQEYLNDKRRDDERLYLG
jgi:hypothetical protein